MLVNPSQRAVFELAHVVLREVLGACLRVDPACLRFDIAPDGKPQLPGRPLEFSMSHAGDGVLVAVAKRDVGVDADLSLGESWRASVATLGETSTIYGFCLGW